MALASSGSLSIKTAAGSGRSIAQEVDGNTTGSKSLTTLSTTAGKTAPHSMLEFYGYTAPTVAPGAPKSFNTVQHRAPSGSNGAELGWTAPSSGGAVANYRLEYRYKEDGQAFFSSWLLALNTTSTGPTLPHSFFVAYPADTEMEFRVRAENSAGVSSYTAWAGVFIYY